MAHSESNVEGLAKIAKPQFERRVCHACNGTGKSPGWIKLRRACSVCRGHKVGRFVLNRVQGWQYLPSWLETRDGHAYDRLVDEYGRIPTWSEIDAYVYSEIDAKFQQSLRELTILRSIKRAFRDAFVPPEVLENKK